MAELKILLRQTLDPAQAKAAEAGLKQAENVAGFSINILQLVADPAVDLVTRQAGALFFKNFVKRHWADEDAQAIQAQEKQLIRTSIVSFMTRMPASVRSQVGEAVAVIAAHDFPRNWESLVDDLIIHINTGDMQVTNGVLHTAHTIFKRWRAQFRSDELFTEIAFVLQKFCQPFLSLFLQVDQQIEKSSGNPTQTAVLLESILLLAKIFYDLNSQDIPEFFEDHMQEFMFIFHKYMRYANTSTSHAVNDEEATSVEKIKASVCEIVELYTQRYEEIFPMLPEFVNTTWQMLTELSLAPKYDILVSKALSLLTCVVKIPRHAKLFEDDNVLKQFVELIVLPNMSLREADQELFEDDPIEFIRRDLEGSDTDTRRRAATELVRGLVQRFEQKVTGLVLQYIEHYLRQYAAASNSDFLAKDTALYLLSAVAVKGSTTKGGVTSTNLMIDVVKFYDDFIAQDLKASSAILQMDAIKYIHTFRNQLTLSQLNSAFPLLIESLRSGNYVVFTYAAVTIDSLLSTTRDRQPLFSRTTTASALPALAQNILQQIERAPTPEKLAENDFLIKCLMRGLIASELVPVDTAASIINHLVEILRKISKNPSNPRFNHYIFECCGSIVRSCASASSGLTNIEPLLLPPLLNILQEETIEFIPYAFQLLAQLLENHSDNGLSNTYQQLLRPILSPSLWDSRGNIPALVRLMQAFLLKGADLIMSAELLEPILGIFQKLIASKVNDSYGFDLLESIYHSIRLDVLSKYANQIFVLLLTRLNNSRTEKFALRFTTFIYNLSASQAVGPDYVISTMSAIQSGIFTQILSGIVLPETQKILKPADSKIASIGLTHFLTKSSILLSDDFPKIWLAVLTCQLKFLELPAQELQQDNFLEIDLDEGFQASFVSLRTAARVSRDQWSQITDPKDYFVQQLNLERQGQNRFVPIITANMPGDAQGLLRNYGVQL